ncbi:MAG: hypothetical protein ABEH38_04450 [Flavobacteriales bacterium]
MPFPFKIRLWFLLLGHLGLLVAGIVYLSKARNSNTQGLLAASLLSTFFSILIQAASWWDWWDHYLLDPRWLGRINLYTWVMSGSLAFILSFKEPDPAMKRVLWGIGLIYLIHGVFVYPSFMLFLRGWAWGSIYSHMFSFFFWSGIPILFLLHMGDERFTRNINFGPSLVLALHSLLAALSYLTFFWHHFFGASGALS